MDLKIEAREKKSIGQIVEERFPEKGRTVILNGLAFSISSTSLKKGYVCMHLEGVETRKEQ